MKLTINGTDHDVDAPPTANAVAVLTGKWLRELPLRV